LQPCLNYSHKESADSWEKTQSSKLYSCTCVIELLLPDCCEVITTKSMVFPIDGKFGITQLKGEVKVSDRFDKKDLT
jgi:hypothetical protein